MTFRRTSNGISNQHMFLGVDAIVFVEGGKNFSFEEVLNGKFSSDSLDILFWRGVFKIFSKGKKYEFRAIGSKSTLLSIAKDIYEGNIENSYVAIDRDFDNLKGELVTSKGTLLTNGYSWENDVWKPEVIEEVLNVTCAANCKKTNLNKEIKKIYDEFLDHIYLGVCVDARLSLTHRTFFNRDKYLMYVKFGTHTIPVANDDIILKKLESCKITKEKALKFGKSYGIEAQKDCLGHLISDFCCHLILYLLKKFSKVPKISKYFICCIGIDKFLEKLKGNKFEDVSRHYTDAFSQL